MAWEPTTDQILNLEGVRRRVDSFRFELCDQELKPIGEVHPDRDQSTPSISADTSAAVSRRLSGLKLLPDEADDVNPLTDRLRAYMVLQNGEEFRLGTFLWGTESKPIRSWGQEQHSELFDFGHILNQRITRPFGWNRGADIGLIMLFFCFRAGFELEGITHLGDGVSRGLAEPKSWEPGVTWRAILIELGDLVGFAAPWFDRDGRLHLDQPPDHALDEPTVPEYTDDTRIIADSIVPNNDLLGAPNDFGVFDSGTDRQRTGRYQLPASAPHSFAERGYKVGRAESVQGLESQAQANKEARNLARTEAVAYEWLEFSSTLDPRHDMWDVVPAFGQNWIETDWDMELRSGGRHKHNLRRTTYEP